MLEGHLFLCVFEHMNILATKPYEPSTIEAWNSARDACHTLTSTSSPLGTHSSYSSLARPTQHSAVECSKPWNILMRV